MNAAARPDGQRASSPGRPRARRPWRPAVLGAGLGGLLGLSLFAPAQWMADGLRRASGERLTLAETSGTIWAGSAVLVLSAGPGSRQAAALPGRLQWAWGWHEGAPSLALRHPCCVAGTLPLRLEPGWGRLRVRWPASSAPLAQWPAAWLSGLGTPWNTLAPTGWLRLHSEGFGIEAVQGRLRVDGVLTLEVDRFASRVSTLPSLGSYRLRVDADPDEGARLALHTVAGPLRLEGSGQWSGQRLRFRGQARADAGAESALNNLLNIIGRRQGALSLIAIG